jgi:hypothetical protein
LREFELMNMKAATRWVVLVTGVNVLVATGYSIAGIVDPASILPAGSAQSGGSMIFALYAAARTIPLAVMALAAIFKRSVAAMLTLGTLAGFVQLMDGFIGIYQRDPGKTFGPFVIGALQFYAVWALRREREKEASHHNPV